MTCNYIGSTCGILESFTGLVFIELGLLFTGHLLYLLSFQCYNCDPKTRELKFHPFMAFDTALSDTMSINHNPTIHL